ncbi:MAG: bifunctional folylpolyglutamate synthase/dihydrofolate synthase [Kiritimatiellae bacterium]|nr:bifunctional folylpolyglutamate synthase/dihydrofolate synthase [Kiritimatiellia bacterium]
MDNRLARLYQRRLHTIKLGLDSVAALLRELDHPQDSFLSIHVAGTNGKGSTCALIASILKSAGFRVGLYTSPHLIRFNERVRFNGEMISDEDLLATMEVVETAAARTQRDGFRDVTFFEFTTALAFEYFRQRGVQVAVIETGMGGRLDATNVVTPVVSVITSIGIDHQAYLGNTIEQIAAEKAGIIKEGRPVVCGTLPDAARTVVRETAHSRSARLIFAVEVCTVTRKSQSLDGQRLTVEAGGETISRVTCPLLGRSALSNIASAVAALQVFSAETQLPISEEAFREGIANARWPARVHVLSHDPDILLDGAHNIEATASLCRAIDELRGKRAVACIASYLDDKDAAGCLRLLASRMEHFWLVLRRGERAMTEDALTAAARQAGVKADIRCLSAALDEGRTWAHETGGLLVITGSLYLAGETLRAFNISV